MSYSDLREESLNEAGIYSGNRHKERQSCRNNGQAVDQAGCRLNIESLYYPALCEGNRGRSHPASGAWQVCTLFESAVAEVPAEIDFGIPGRRKWREVEDHAQANEQRDDPLAF